MTVRGAGMAAIWLLEWLLWLLGAGIVVASAASRPYCTRCQSGYDRQARGRVPVDRQAELLALLSVSPSKLPAGEVRELEYESLACREGCSPPVFIHEQAVDGAYLRSRRRLVYRGQLESPRAEAVRRALDDSFRRPTTLQP
jgi:hypothetical protein